MDATPLLEPIRALHAKIRDAVVAACEQQSAATLAAVDAEESSDTIYRIDRVSEEILIADLASVAAEHSMVVLAEGLAEGSLVLPRGARESNCRWRVLVDPIDGTRGLMYQKRSAWILTGVAPNRGAETRLRDVVLAVQTEIPLVKQHLSDQLWATRGGGARGTRTNR
ncbi:MAG TPA: inositol monophosphatase family protein, partial [Gemmatimonadaceae bacterium]|nr:inositol monophosphatase family protein [Gemmatimonadaceae bacterium]